MVGGGGKRYVQSLWENCVVHLTACKKLNNFANTGAIALIFVSNYLESIDLCVHSQNLLKFCIKKTHTITRLYD